MTMYKTYPIFLTSSAEEKTNMAFNAATAQNLQKKYQDSQARQSGMFNCKIKIDNRYRNMIRL